MGGGVMRTAAKVAGIGSVMHGGLRGSPAAPSSGKSVRTASVPVAAGISAQSGKGGDRSAIEKPLLEATTAEDWQMVGEGELVMSAGEPMPRVVFGAAPSFQEAKEATDELKDALDKAYLSSPKITELGELTAADKVSGLSQLSNPEAESLLITRTSVPQHAYQAFELLSRSTEAQNVVASIASDPNIWNAMMENSAVKQFMESQQNINYARYESEASDSEVFNPVSSKEIVEEHDSSQSFDLERLFNGFVDKVKLTVNTIVSNLSTYIQSIFGPPADDNGPTRTAITSGFMGLAVMVVMVVLLKRA
ncbi:uncharacterized protein LOC133734735 [Rosa rugosa]|uniref:uncharacterized protein LOC133734735 n=1 Tax=Rosa rugosa TaxID=74645 RepID=UPI002B404791|nr:uncharacterized protein LOC133734735 [Rosa rugosa]